MRRYQQVSGAFFSLIAIAQLTRAVAGWPVQVATVTVPVWCSVVAFFATAALAIWAFQTAKSAT